MPSEKFSRNANSHFSITVSRLPALPFTNSSLRDEKQNGNSALGRTSLPDRTGNRSRTIFVLYSIAFWNKNSPIAICYRSVTATKSTRGGGHTLGAADTRGLVDHRPNRSRARRAAASKIRPNFVRAICDDGSQCVYRFVHYTRRGGRTAERERKKKLPSGTGRRGWKKLSVFDGFYASIFAAGACVPRPSGWRTRPSRLSRRGYLRRGTGGRTTRVYLLYPTAVVFFLRFPPNASSLCCRGAAGSPR